MQLASFFIGLSDIKEITVIEELPIKYGRFSNDPPAAERI